MVAVYVLWRLEYDGGETLSVHATLDGAKRVGEALIRRIHGRDVACAWDEQDTVALGIYHEDPELRPMRGWYVGAESWRWEYLISEFEVRGD